ncbi:glycosyltransferase family 2 protein [Novosphingobium beihaiensis]|uniref:Glycosyltransferase family 2 protein n=1 Tax=Novosphingobium beihaiensis TaxID=2930389 RepID=A0ABT0BUW0_9SPHN|nr:glycosyltransferase family A protein [Novosphingobium beihaiensis]MCJ2188855.1 glycosyltransferase family 2 protein [Novosphingobium beihaiensis]
MTTPHFSVVVPVYNAGAALEATVHSVLAQTETDFDLWLIDDGSTDDSLARMRKLSESDERIRVVSKANGGVASARNTGAELSSGRYIAFLDADDMWHPEKLAQHRAFHARAPQAGCSFARIAFLEPGNDDLHAAKTFSAGYADMVPISEVLGENPVCTGSNIVVSRACFEAVGGFKAGMNYAEDQEWLARVVGQGFALAGIDAVLVGYRMSPGGLSSNLEAMYAGWRTLAGEYAGVADFDHATAEALYCRYLSRRALRNGASAVQALRFALAGVSRDAKAFFGDARRGGLTLAGALFGLMLPAPVRVRLFA